MAINLFGVEMGGGTFQLGLIQGNFAGSFPSTVQLIPVAYLALLRNSDGRLFYASDMQIKVQPGWLRSDQGPIGTEKAVFHAKAEGNCIPNEVTTTLGSAVSPYPGSPELATIVNHSDTTKTRYYSIDSSSYLILDRLRSTFPDSNSFSAIAGGISYNGTQQLTSDGDNIHYHFEYVGYYQERIVDSYIPKDSLSYRQGIAKPNISNGSCTVRYRTLHPTGAWKETTYSESRMSFRAYSAPVSLAHITSQVFFAGTGSSLLERINSDLLSLSRIDPGNSSWLSCYYAVESMKYLNFQWAAYIKDSLDIKSLLKPLTKFTTRALNKPKWWADLFLWWSYGVAPQFDDTKKLIDKLVPLRNYTIEQLARDYSRSHTKYGTSYTTALFEGNEVTVKCNAKAMLHTRVQPNNMVETLFLFLQSLDLGIDVTNIWELIPYSFISDWFVNTDELVKWEKYSFFSNLYDLELLVSSQKNTVEMSQMRYIDGPIWPFVKLTTYTRTLSKVFPKQPFDLKFMTPSGHALEGAALLISKFF